MEFIQTIFDSPIKAILMILGSVLFSISGAFVKDWIIKLVSHFSLAVKKYREKQKTQLKEQSEFLLNNLNFLILYGLRTIITIVLMLSMMILSFIFPLHIYTNPKFTEKNKLLTSTLNNWDLSQPEVVTIIVMLLSISILYALMLFLCYKASKRTKLLLYTIRMLHKNIGKKIHLP